MNDPNAIAVIIPAYNASATISRAVISALREPEVAEVIVVDDESVDDTIAEAKSVDDGTGRLKIVKLIINKGPSGARNRAIIESTAPWISILDSDDFLMPGRFKPLLELADKADFIADDMWQVMENKTGDLRKSLFGDLIKEPRTISFAQFVRSNVTRNNRYRCELGFIKPIMRRRFLETHQLRYRETMRLGEDYELYARALACGARLMLTPNRGYVSVMRSNSLSGEHSSDDLLQLRNCDESLSGMAGLTDNDRRALREHYLSTDCRLQWRLLIEAVKRRHFSSALETFQRPHPIPLFLLSKLAQECFVRIGRFFGFKHA